MLSKCANPSCSAAFLYLHEGKLFRIETQATNGAAAFRSDPESKKKGQQIEFFWLCRECSETMTLSFEKGAGIKVRRVDAEHAVAS